MYFLYPWVLWFSFLVAVPIIIHLFYFRRYKTVYFSRNDLLENVIKQSRSQQKLRNLIVLLLRILFVLALVFAFAQPYQKRTNDAFIEQTDAYVLYIDNSFSMNDEGEQGVSLLEEAKSKAITLVQSLPKNVKYFLLTNNSNYSVDKLFSSDEVQKKISEISVVSSSLRWSEVLKRLQEAVETRMMSRTIPVAWFSDGQKYAVDYPAWQNDSIPLSLFYMSHAKNNNISIDSVWFEKPQHLIYQREQLWTTLTNHGHDDVAALPVKLYINDTLKATATINLASKATEKVVFDFVNMRAGWHNGRVEIADFPISFDNTYYFSFNVFSGIKVAVISDQTSSHLQAFFKSDSLFNSVFLSWNAASSKTLSDKQVIILYHVNNISTGLWSELLEMVKKGKVIIIIPSANLQIAEMNTLLQKIGIIYMPKDTTRLNLAINSIDQEFFKGLFVKKEERLAMPWVNLKYPIQLQNNVISDVILSFENGQNALVHLKYEKGNIFCFAHPMLSQNTNLQVHPLFVALFHRMMEKSLQTTALYYTLHPQLSISIPVDTVLMDKPVELQNINTLSTQIPMQQYRYNELNISPNVNEMEAGIYWIIQNNKEIHRLALNYSRKESEMNFYTAEQLSDFFKQKGYKVNLYTVQDLDLLKYTISNEQRGKEWWKWLLGLAFIFLLSEMLIIRFWKVVK